MINSSKSWVDKCIRQNQLLYSQLTLKLPPALKSTAISGLKSHCSWEFKHFWIENIKLWIRQSERTKKLSREWSDINDLILDDWNKSEYSSTFMKALNRGVSFKKSSELALSDLKFQMIQMGVRYFGTPGKLNRNYKKLFELGEFEKKISFSEVIYLNDKTVDFYSWDKKNFSLHLHSILKALTVIKSNSPDSFEYFKTFTKRIIPINQREFVSYSLQTLPGHSFINLYNRDFLDLIDDLLHENGHHHLNYFLILENPLNEDDELIYYSPWRKTLRPIRGIYHAHLTFYFALKIYHDLALKLKSDDLSWPGKISDKQIQKIYGRFLEEWYMLEYTSHDLKLAYKRGQIKKCGFDLFNEFEIERKSFSSMVKYAEKKLVNKSKINSIRKTLDDQREITYLN
ncbi:MAG: hypothetical protein K2P81_12640 [Bacteriovoracaceae bacterium]|nr:hypothetical protein [Bacteriovoracaceae bacterium]